MRKAIMYLQSASQLRTESNSTYSIDKAIIGEITGMVPFETIENLAMVWKSKNLTNIQKALDSLRREGYSGDQIVDQVRLLFIILTKLSNTSFSIILLRMSR